MCITKNIGVHKHKNKTQIVIKQNYPLINTTCKSLYPLFLAGNKCLEPGCHSKPKLVNEGRLVLTVDLNFDPSFKWCLICRKTKCVTHCEKRHFSRHLKEVSVRVSHSEVLTPTHTSTQTKLTLAHTHCVLECDRSSDLPTTKWSKWYSPHLFLPTLAGTHPAECPA